MVFFDPSVLLQHKCATQGTIISVTGNITLRQAQDERKRCRDKPACVKAQVDKPGMTQPFLAFVTCPKFCTFAAPENEGFFTSVGVPKSLNGLCCVLCVCPLLRKKANKRI